MGAAPEWDGAKPRTDLVGDSRNWPPGFRFHPTDEELVLYYLKRKLCRRRISLPIIGEVDVYKWEPWELPEKSVVRSGDKQWYFFSPRDRKYPNGSRSNRSTRRGYWKATGKDRTISTMGNKKTLVYYHGRPPKGERTDWVMHEYTLDEQALGNDRVHDPYALYKVFRKSGPGPKNGEEYGAPFREEEWDNEDADCFTKDHHGKILVKSNHVLVNDLPEIPLDSGCTSAHALEVEYAADVVGSHILWQNCDEVSTAMSSIISPPPHMESLVEEGLDDFLEMKDLNDTDGLYDPYDYFDADMYLAEAMKPALDGVISDTYFDVFEDYGETQEQASDMISELWTHEQPLLEGISPTTGDGYNTTITNTMGEMSEGGDVSETWFSTALSALLDSIPNSPAIASENPMIVRAFERVSSFKLGKTSTTMATATGAGIGRRPVAHSGGLLFISFLVGLGAILWVLSIGAAVKGLKCLWGRFV